MNMQLIGAFLAELRKEKILRKMNWANKSA